jgi:hypothetical protein
VAATTTAGPSGRSSPPDRDFSVTADTLPVADRRRDGLGRAVGAVLVVSLLFYADIWLSKEIPAVYARTPWRDDPYDAVISFMFVAVPLLGGLMAVRLRLCRRFEPLPRRRALNLLQIGWLLCWAMGVTLVGEWTSLAVPGHPLAFGWASVGLIGLLSLMSAAVLAVTVRLRKTQRSAWAREPAPQQPDWLADAVAVVEREASRFGQPGAVVEHLAGWAERSLIARVRRHPLWAAGMFAILVSLLSDSPQIVLERYRPAMAAWFLSVSCCALFAFVVIAARYLHLVEQPLRRSGPAVYALVLAALCVPVVASFRASLWWIIGAHDSTAGLSQLAELTTALPLATGVLTYAVRRLVDSRKGPAAAA